MPNEMTNEMYKFVCWDTNRIATVIDKQAVSVDRPIFMATHAPFKKITYLKSPAKISNDRQDRALLPSTSEELLLNELCSRTAHDQHTFVVVQGIHGSGKSHLIRWLKERYAAHNEQEGRNDIVLLIERANNTLRQTLYQILDSAVFDDATFASQRDKLDRAARQLSNEGLENSLISNLHTAFIEDRGKPEHAQSLKKNLARHLEHFLLDPNIREELRLRKGPIPRITRFLSTGNAPADGDESPSFRPSDFDFPIEFLQELKNKSHLQDAKDLVDKLTNSDNRKQLANYLNYLLEFAIGQTMALSSDDLKQMFNQLRRELRQQGRSLALYIEDITAFTGLDTGLIDILITQHTGESNREFCRILSVVGVTDEYYNDKFPGNVKDRISHHLNLNDLQNQKDAELLSSEEATADLAARYLNALRLEPAVLTEWFADGGDLAKLPNACRSCPFQSTCHATFGAVQLRDHDQEAVGLYPFNADALWKMYQNVDKAQRTPRTLLNAVLSYVLLSHSHLIPKGLFPPRRQEMGSEFSAPTLAKPAQRGLLEEKGLTSQQQERIESLIVFWGDRTLDTTKGNDQELLGNLSEELFKVFGLPFIVGPVVVEPVIVGPPVIEPPVVGPDPIPGPKQVQVSADDPYVVDIENWRGGALLVKYNELGALLTRFIKDAIDWESYDIVPALVDKRVSIAQMRIEGQTGRTNSTYVLLLPRSNALAKALQAVYMLQQKRNQLSSAEIAVYMLHLATWLEENEEQIVAFVGAPQADIVDPVPLVKLQTQAAIILAVLAGELNGEASKSTENLFDQLIKSSKEDKNWERAINKARGLHNSDWVKLMERPGVKNDLSHLRNELFSTLNCAQGNSKDVLFIDAATLLDQLKSFRQIDWLLAPLTYEGEGDLWKRTIKMHNAFATTFAMVIESERTRLTALQTSLTVLMGGASGRDTDNAIRKILSALDKSQLPIPPELDEKNKPPFTVIDGSLAWLKNRENDTAISDFAPAVSGADDMITRLQDASRYLEQLRSHLAKQMEKWQAELLTAAASNEVIEMAKSDVQRRYVALDEKLASLTPEGIAL